jgi:hypothetical protein
MSESRGLVLSGAMSESGRRILGEINGVPLVEPRPGDHMFSDLLDGDCPGEGRIVCACGWTSESAPRETLDLTAHFAEVNGISCDEQRERTAEVMRRLCVARPETGRMN